MRRKIDTKLMYGSFPPRFEFEAGSGGIQTSVGTEMARGVQGQYASTNPRKSWVAGPGGLVAGAAGVTVGQFAWINYSTTDGDNAPATANNFAGALGPYFVANEQQALISVYLASSSLVVPGGFGITLMTDGDYWVVNNGSTYATPGMSAFANLANGQVSFAATGTSVATASGSASAVAAQSVTFTGQITGNVLNVTTTAVPVYPGMTLSGTGVTSGVQIAKQLTGTAQGVGTYALTIGEMATASETITATYGLLTVGGTVVSGFEVGSVIAGTSVVSGTTITALGTGTGAAGTYVVNNNTVVSSTAITATTLVQTKWVALSGGGAGEIVKMGTP